MIATGSEDASIKILDVNRILAKADEPEDADASKSVKEQLETHPVIRTLYDHTEVCHCKSENLPLYILLVIIYKPCYLYLVFCETQDLVNPSFVWLNRVFNTIMRSFFKF